MRLREERVALSADTKCMFHHVRVPLDDQDKFRFLWWLDGTLYQQPVKHRMEVHSFGETSWPSCRNFTLKRAADDNNGKFANEVVTTSKSVKSAKYTVEFTHQLRSIMFKGGFRLNKWSNNSQEALDCIPQVEKPLSVLGLELDKKPHLFNLT